MDQRPSSSRDASSRDHDTEGYDEDMDLNDKRHQMNVPEDLSTQARDRRIVNNLIDIVDYVDQNYTIKDYFNGIQITEENADKTMISIVEGMFNDGVISWGRIFMLMYAGFLVILKLSCRSSALRKITTLIVKILIRWFASWISEQGGWEAGLKIFRASRNHVLGLVIVASLGVLITMWLKK